MAETIAVIGLLAAITQFVEYGFLVVQRLDEFSTATTEVPESFRSIHVRLALVIDTLRRVQAQARASHVSEATAAALKPVVESSLDHVHELSKILDKAVPEGKFSTFEKRLQALKSLTYDRKVQKILVQLHGDIEILNFHQSTSHFDLSEKIRSELSRLTLPPTSPTINYSLGVCLGGAPEIDDQLFVGREAELTRLQELLTPRLSPSAQNVVAVSAMGGLGKTQLSLAFIRRHHATYSSVFWFNAKDEATLRKDYVTLSRRVLDQERMIRLSNHETEDQAVQQVRQWFSQEDNGRWLIIFDNYDDPSIPGLRSVTGYDIRNYFPHRRHGSILITTRSRRLTFAKQLRLQKLADIDESLAILSKRSQRNLMSDPKAIQLAKRLDGLPLALATAGMYLSQTADSVSEYLDSYESYWHELRDDADELIEYEDRTLFSTWNLSLAQIRVQEPEAAELLRLLAYFGNQDLWYDLFKPGADCGFPWLVKLTENKRRFDRAMTRLHDYSLVEISTGGYSLHTCVHDWTLQGLNGQIDNQYYWVAVHCVASNVKEETEREYWTVNRRLEGHALQLEHARFLDFTDEVALEEQRCGNLGRLGLLWSSRSENLRAEVMFQRSLVGYEEVLGFDHTLTLVAVSRLGTLYQDQGKLEEAEQMYRRVLAGREKALGPDHTSTLETVHNLATLYRVQDKSEEAEQMYRRALAGFKKALGPDHTSTLNTVHNLAGLYRVQDKLEESEQMYRRALAGYEKALGPDHTSTLDTVHNLAGLYRVQDKLEESEQMYQRALAGCEKALGTDHTSTLSTVNGLGILYRVQSKLEEAEQMYRRALAGYEKALGPDHTSTLDTVHNLAGLYRVQGKLEESKQMYQRALAGCEKALGPDHTSTLLTVYNLAKLYHEQDKLEEAEVMYQRALEGYEKTLGSDHTSTLKTADCLGAIYHDQNKLEEAEVLYQRTLAGFTKMLGPNHRYTSIATKKLEALVQQQEQIKAGEAMSC